jgi:hypothetical protein
MFDNPNTLINSWGRVAFDRPLQIKLIGSVMLPLDIVFTGYLQHRSGSAWRRTISRVYFPSSIDTQDTYDNIAPETNGTRRNAPYTMLDIRVEKSFTFGEFGRLSFYIDGFNLAGRSGFSVEQNPNPYLYPYRDPPEIRVDTDYADVTGVYGIRSFRIGAKFSF